MKKFFSQNQTVQQPDWIDARRFHSDVDYIEKLWQYLPVGTTRLQLIDSGNGAPLVFVPVLEQLEWLYAPHLRVLSQERRVILYRRRETRSTPISLNERVQELVELLDLLEIPQADLLGHGNAAMIVLAFALRYPQRCRSLTLIAQGATQGTTPHPLIWLLHELYQRLPIELVLPAPLLRKLALHYLCTPAGSRLAVSALPARLLDEQLLKINEWPLVYKYSLLPIIHGFNVRKRVRELKMPVLLINAFNDPLAPQTRTQWLAHHLPSCNGYHLIKSEEHFFMYSQAKLVNALIQNFLSTRQLPLFQNQNISARYPSSEETRL